MNIFDDIKRMRRLCIATIIFFICFSCLLCVGAYNLDNKLVEITNMFDITKNKLFDTQAVLNNEVARASDLESDLEVANFALDSIDSEQYIFDLSVSEEEVDIIAKTVWGEARGCSPLQQSGVVWCILNRVDAGYGTIAQVATYGAFHGYDPDFPVTPEIRELVIDVIARWKLEKITGYEVGRTLPSEYLFFSANNAGTKNVFRTHWEGNYTVWNWDCWNPYE